MKKRTTVWVAIGCVCVALLGALSVLARFSRPDPAGPAARERERGGAAAAAPQAPVASAETIAAAEVERAKVDFEVPNVACVDSRTHAALRGVSIEAKLHDAPAEPLAHGVTDAAGRWTLPRPGRWTVRTSLAGYYDRTFTQDFALGPTAIALDPSPRLEVRLVTSTGRPVSGVELVLVPPLDVAEEWRDGWAQRLESLWSDRDQAAARASLERPSPTERPRSDVGAADSSSAWADETIAEYATLDACVRRTDSDGRAVWDRMPNVEGYRWGVRSKHVVRLEPPHERPRIRDLDAERVQLDASAPTGLSGVVRLVCGETTRIEAQALPSGSVAGFVDFGKPMRAAHARILGAAQGEGGGSRVVERQVEHGLALESDGGFVFDQVPPGTKLLRAFGWTLDGSIRFAAVQFELAPGEAKDLGIVKARTGSTVTLDLRLRDRGGREVSPKDVFVQGEARVDVGLSLFAKSRSVVDRCHETFEVPVGGLVELEGMADGALLVNLHEGTLWELDPARRTRVRMPTYAEHEVRGDTQVDLGLSVEKFVIVQFRPKVALALDPAGIQLDGLRTGSCDEIRTRARADIGLGSGADIVLTIELAPGRHVFVGHPGPSLEPIRGASYVAVRELDVTEQEQQEYDLEFTLGADIEGQLLRKSGEPAANSFVSFRIEPWISNGCARALYVSNTDADGRFRVRGLPPRTAFEASDRSRGTTGAAGETIQVVLRESR